MEKLLDLKDGVAGLLVSICVLLSLQLVFRTGMFLWALREKKESASENAIKELTAVVRLNTVATEHLDARLGEIENTLSELPKFKLDMRRMFTAIKLIAGEKWPQIRKEIEEENRSL